MFQIREGLEEILIVAFFRQNSLNLIIFVNFWPFIHQKFLFVIIGIFRLAWVFILRKFVIILRRGLNCGLWFGQRKDWGHVYPFSQLMKVRPNQILELLHQVALVSVITEFLFKFQNNVIVFVLKLGVVLDCITFVVYFNNLRWAVILDQRWVIRLVYPHFNHASRQFTELHGFFH